MRKIMGAFLQTFVENAPEAHTVTQEPSGRDICPRDEIKICFDVNVGLMQK
jgi:hypothetical protein